MLDITQLKAELASYPGLTDAATAAALNAQTVATDVDVSVTLIARRLIGQGILGRIDARIAYYAPKVGASVSTNGADEVALSKLHTARRSLELLPTLEMSNAQTKAFVQSMTTDLVAEGVMSAGQRTALLALADGFMSRAEQLFGRGVIVEPGHVARARLA